MTAINGNVNATKICIIGSVVINDAISILILIRVVNWSLDHMLVILCDSFTSNTILLYFL